MKVKQRKVTVLSAIVYTAISLAVASAFYVTASALSNYTAVAIYGGTAWIFLLSMIVTMPTVVPWMKKRLVARA